MIIIIKTPGSERRWKIAPVDSGLCFGVWKEPVRKIGKNKQPIKAEWLFTERYPTSLASAVTSVVDLMSMDPDDPYVMEPETIEDLIDGLQLWHRNITWEIKHKNQTEKVKAKAEVKPKAKKASTTKSKKEKADDQSH